MDLIIGKKSRLSLMLNYMHPNSNIVSGRDPIEPQLLQEAQNIFICSAITKPNSDPIAIKAINVDLPLRIADQNKHANIITFGTILENRVEIKNNYVDSKRQLVKELGENSCKFIHFRLNTLYGIGKPKHEMFLHDLFISISKTEKLKMSSGYQLREYHHYFDVAKIILREVQNSSVGINEISTGLPITLRDLAKGVCRNFSENIVIEYEDNVQNEIFDSNKSYYSPELFRDPIIGVTNYFKGLI